MATFHPLSAAYLADPYPYLARLRVAEPVHYNPDLQGWILTRYADCEAVLSDPARFSSDPIRHTGDFGRAVREARAAAALGDTPILANTDPPDHGRLRGPVLGAFSPNQVEPRRPFLAEAVGHLLEPLSDGRAGDVMAILAEPLPLIALLDYLGVPVAARDLFRQCVVSIMSARMAARPGSPEALASQQAAEVLRDLIRAARESSPLFARFLESVDAEAISEDEMLMLVVHIATAGNAATAFAIGSGLLSLARHPDAWHALRDDASLVPGAVSEMLRYDSPTHITTRFATVDAEFHGRRIRAGQAVHLVLASANRDPEAFPDPDTFDIHRKTSRHATFGLGNHFCLGAPLGRLEMEVAFSELTRRFDHAELLDGGYTPGGTLFLRGPRRLVLRLAPAAVPA